MFSILSIALTALFFFSCALCGRPLPHPSEFYENGPDHGRVGVINFATPDVWDYARYSVRLWQRYADRHQYDFFLVPLSLNRTRHDVWTKVLASEVYLQKVDWLLFAEADTYPINEELSVENQLIERFVDDETLCVLGSNCGTERYCWDEGPNTGVFLLRNDPKTFEMLRYWFEVAEKGQECAKYYDWHPREQLTFWHCVMKRYPAPLIKQIKYVHIHGIDGEFIKHMLGAAFSHERKIEEMNRVYLERGLNRTCTMKQYPC